MSEEQVEFLKGIIVKVCILVLVMFCVAGGCSYCNERVGLANDNFIEELIEFAIESKLGFPHGTIDLTQDSKE